MVFLNRSNTILSSITQSKNTLAHLLKWSSLFLVLFISACGGGGGGGTPDNEPDELTVNAALDFAVDESTLVNITGIAGGAESITFAWTTSETSITIEQPAAESPDATFTAPPITGEDSLAITLTLTATAGDGSTASDDLVVTVNPIPVVVDAGSDITTDENTVVNLSGSAVGAVAFTYAWSTTNTTITITQPDTAAATASFTSPTVVGTPLDIPLTLTATADDGTVATDELLVTVNAVNAEPVANIAASQDIRFTENTYPGAVQITLDGSGSTDSDPIDGASEAIVSYQWAQVTGTNVTAGLVLDTSSLTITTPALDVSETLQLSLTVTDTEGATNTQTVELTVLDVTQSPPLVEAGIDQTIMEGETLIMSGSGTSLSADATPYIYEWITDTTPEFTFDNSSAAPGAQAPMVTADTSTTIRLRIIDQFDNSETDTLTVTVRDLPTSLMNDTGMTTIVDASSITTSTIDYPGQDGDLGRDRINANNALEKAGTGEASFDFTKLNNLGDEVESTATDWDCVRDNVTGLIWEVKTNDAGLHDRDNTYSWFSDDTSLNGGVDGDLNGAGTSCTFAQCNTQEYAAQVNAVGLCGFFDWRLPTYNELMSIMHFGNTTTAYIDENLFPFTSADNTTPTWYWTNVANSDGSLGDAAQSSWAIDFSSGNDNFLSKSTPNSIRLVRAGR